MDQESEAAAKGYLSGIDRAALPERDYPNFVKEPADASAFFADDTWRRLSSRGKEVELAATLSN